MMKMLTDLVRGLHWSVGITPPAPEKERVLVFVWLGILLGMAVFFVLLIYFFR